jgi:hypothetical protein
MYREDQDGKGNPVGSTLFMYALDSNITYTRYFGLSFN